jgi:N-acetylglucosaminyl-diphospho-decaprenol L-rhamnosyltransferase
MIPDNTSTDCMTSSAGVSVIIVSHNSQAWLPQCLRALRQQTVRPCQIIIVDNGSDKTDYLRQYEHDSSITLFIAQSNVGFCQGNNIGLALVDTESRYILFLNPDAFLTPSFLEQAIHKMELPSAQQIGALSGLLLGYNIHSQQPNGLIDSAAIFRTWYGRWYDRGQGEPYRPGLYQATDVPALCGAALLCRVSALKAIELAPGVVMDPIFYMYKEDIDVSLRLRRQGWLLRLAPNLVVYHCRGWQKDRSRMPRHARLGSARNEMRVYARSKSPRYLYSALKYIAVTILDL